MTDRRNKQDRRLSSDRRTRERKRATQEVFTVIEIEDSNLRVVSLTRSQSDQDDQVRAMVLKWRHEASSLNSELGIVELTKALRELVEVHALQTTNVQFVLGGQLCVTKAVRGTSEQVRNELQQIEQRSRLYLLLGPGEKVTVKWSQPIDARHKNAIAAVCNKQTLDTIHNAASNAGMQVSSIEPALISLSRAIGRLSDVPDEPCLLIRVDANTAELGICLDGNLLLDYRPGGKTDPEELVQLVSNHLSRLQRHVGRQLNEKPPTLKRVYLCGEAGAVERAFRVFQSNSQFDVEVVDPTKIQATWKYADIVEDSATVPALGAMLSNYLPKGEHDAPNFMEHILASTREPIKPILIRSTMPAAAVLLVAAILFAYNYSQQLSIDRLQSQLEGLTSSQVRERELCLKREAAKAKLKQLHALIDTTQSLPASEVIARIGYCMPSDVWLNRLELTDLQQIQLSGSCYLERGVFDFVNGLEQAPGFADVALRSTSPGQSAAGPAINFNVELNLTDWEEPIQEVARNE